MQGSVQSTVHRVRVYHVALAHDKYQNSISFPSFPSFPPHFLSPQMALQAHGGGGRGRGMLLNKLGRGKLQKSLHCNSKNAIRTYVDEGKFAQWKKLWRVINGGWEEVKRRIKGNIQRFVCSHLFEMCITRTSCQSKASQAVHLL